MIRIDGLDHATLRCEPGQLDALRAFYCELLGLTEGARPAFDFPGHWLYAGGRPVLHLAAILPAGTVAQEQSTASATGVLGTLVHRTGGLDHLAFTANDLARSRDALRAKNVRFTEAPVPGMPLYQLFLNDPVGVKIELTFTVAA